MKVYITEVYSCDNSMIVAVSSTKERALLLQNDIDIETYGCYCCEHRSGIFTTEFEINSKPRDITKAERY
jgi:hypothetical protein